MFPPRYPPISNLYLLHFFPCISIRNLSFSRRRERNGRKSDGCEPAAKASISITRMPIVYRFRSSFFATFLSLPLSLSPPPSPQETSTSPFSFRPVETDYVFNGVPLVWWEISFKPVVVSLVACLLCQSFKIRRIRGKFVLSEGYCTNFYLSEKLTLMDLLFFRSSREKKVRLNLQWILICLLENCWKIYWK